MASIWDFTAVNPSTQSNEVFEEIRRHVKGYNIPAASLLSATKIDKFQVGLRAIDE